jgi:nitrite reductase (NADH) small subunit
MSETVNRKWYLVADVNSVPLNEGRSVRWGKYQVALFNLGGEYRAIDNRCPHKAGPLADGIVAGKAVFCPLHNWKVNLENGCAIGEDKRKVKVFPVKVMNGLVYIAFEEAKFHEECEKLESQRV